MNGNETFIGLVIAGQFKSVEPKRADGSVRLTAVRMSEARPPESEALDLTEYEGMAIAVQGHDGGGWIYSAQVIEQSGPILTAVVQKVFDQNA